MTHSLPDRVSHIVVNRKSEIMKIFGMLVMIRIVFLSFLPAPLCFLFFLRDFSASNGDKDPSRALP